jgi:hypothetical protein
MLNQVQQTTMQMQPNALIRCGSFPGGNRGCWWQMYHPFRIDRSMEKGRCSITKLDCGAIIAVVELEGFTLYESRKRHSQPVLQVATLGDAVICPLQIIP